MNAHCVGKSKDNQHVVLPLHSLLVDILGLALRIRCGCGKLLLGLLVLDPLVYYVFAVYRCKEVG